MWFIMLDLPGGLAGTGVYELRPFSSVDHRLDDGVLRPERILSALAREHGVERLYARRLASRGECVGYIARPTPLSLALTFDGCTGERIDALPPETVDRIVQEEVMSRPAFEHLGKVRSSESTGPPASGPTTSGSRTGG